MDILFYAPIGKSIREFKNGGAESGCIKTIEILKKEGYSLKLIEKPTKINESAIGSIILLFKLLLVWIKLIYSFFRNKDSVFYLVGFYLNLVYFEWFIIVTAKYLGIKTIYEIRNGGMVESFQAGNRTYKYFLKSVFKHSDLVLCQGLDYVNFLKINFKKKSVYYPNYILDDFISSNDIKRNKDELVKLIYFGRVVEDKNIALIIEVCKELRSKNFNFILNIIGGYESKYYGQLVKNIELHDLNSKIKFHGRLSFVEIVKFLKTSHFFIFPSKEQREGHSNSLTESMGCGVVPIVSPAGFNRTIVNDESLVINSYSSMEYADRIHSIWLNNLWQLKSNHVHQRVLNNYSEKIVSKYLLTSIDKLIHEKSI